MPDISRADLRRRTRRPARDRPGVPEPAARQERQQQRDERDGPGVLEQVAEVCRDAAGASNWANTGSTSSPKPVGDHQRPAAAVRAGGARRSARRPRTRRRQPEDARAGRRPPRRESATRPRLGGDVTPTARPRTPGGGGRREAPEDARVTGAQRSLRERSPASEQRPYSRRRGLKTCRRDQLLPDHGLVDDLDAELLGLCGLAGADVGAADQHVGVGRRPTTRSSRPPARRGAGTSAAGSSRPSADRRSCR